MPKKNSAKFRTRYEYSLSELCELKGITFGELKKTIVSGELKPQSFKSVIEWLGAEVKMAERPGVFGRPQSLVQSSLVASTMDAIAERIDVGTPIKAEKEQVCIPI